MRNADVEAEITLLPASEGGRSATRSGYRPQHRILADYLTSGVHEYFDRELLLPGETALGRITFITPEAYPHCLYVGQVLDIQEGNRIIGHAKITRILNELLACGPHGSPDMAPGHYQDESFTVDRVAGDQVDMLLGFPSGPSDRPEKLLLRLRAAGWIEIYLSAYLGHWHPIGAIDLAEIRRDYSQVRLVDYGSMFDLHGATVLEVRCVRSMPEGTSIRIGLDRGSITLREEVASDPHADSIIHWEPRP